MKNVEELFKEVDYKVDFDKEYTKRYICATPYGSYTVTFKKNKKQLFINGDFKDYKEYINYQGRDKFIIAIKTQIKEFNWGA